MRLLLFSAAVLAITNATPRGVCDYGWRYIDECENACDCLPSGDYGCTKKGCPPGKVATRPMTCEVEGEVRVQGGWNIRCKNGIVTPEPVSGEDLCTPGTAWRDGCNTCNCGTYNQIECTRKACLTDVPRPILSPPGHPVGGSGGQEVELQFGDVLVTGGQRCPRGLIAGPPGPPAPAQSGPYAPPRPPTLDKICRAQSCVPGSNWATNRGCSQCICTNDGEPACTLCERGPTEDTQTCDGAPRCPADCGQAYNAEHDCYECPCAVGRSGDITVPPGQPCPPGTDFREAGAFFWACAPFADLRQGNHRVCGDQPECPPDCTLVRIGDNEGCAFCQCGPIVGPGDITVAIDEPCPPATVPGPSDAFLKACRAANKEACSAVGSEYNVECDICICTEGGKPACTRRDCSEPKYGDVQVCRTEYRECPQDCGTAGSDSYCQFCQCGPRLEEGDIVVAIDQPCPAGTRHKATQWATKTCGKSAEDACEHGPKFIDECGNDCKCIDGKFYGCTRKACRSGERPEVPMSCDGSAGLPKRSGRRVFCHEGKVKVQDLDAPCVSGSNFMDEDDCNGCFCSDNGVAGCTLKACVTIPVLPQTECPYGPHYIDECLNDCKCDSRGLRCTEKACPVGATAQRARKCRPSLPPARGGQRVFCHDRVVKVQPLEETCLLGATFKIDCNLCRCGRNGNIACTYKRCHRH